MALVSVPRPKDVRRQLEHSEGGERQLDGQHEQQECRSENVWFRELRYEQRHEQQRDQQQQQPAAATAAALAA